MGCGVLWRRLNPGVIDHDACATLFLAFYLDFKFNPRLVWQAAAANPSLSAD